MADKRFITPYLVSVIVLTIITYALKIFEFKVQSNGQITMPASAMIHPNMINNEADSISPPVDSSQRRDTLTVSQ